MESLTQVFNYEGLSVRTVVLDGEAWFVAKDVCDALGIGSVSLAVNGNPTRGDIGLEDDEKGAYNVNTPGGVQQLTCVTEYGVYSLIFKSRRPEARAFKRWVTHEVLPSIRKTGMYATDDLLDDPDLLLKTVTRLRDERQLRLLAEEKAQALQLETAIQAVIIADQAPKISYYDTILRSPDAITITQIASDYKISPQVLNEFLRDHGVQRKVGGQWVIRAAHVNSGFTKSETISFGERGTRVYTKWTQKGRLFIYDLINEHGIPKATERKKRRGNDRKRAPAARKPISATVTITLNR